MTGLALRSKTADSRRNAPKCRPVNLLRAGACIGRRRAKVSDSHAGWTGAFVPECIGRRRAKVCDGRCSQGADSNRPSHVSAGKGRMPVTEERVRPFRNTQSPPRQSGRARLSNIIPRAPCSALLRSRRPSTRLRHHVQPLPHSRRARALGDLRRGLDHLHRGLALLLGVVEDLPGDADARGGGKINVADVGRGGDRHRPRHRPAREAGSANPGRAPGTRRSAPASGPVIRTVSLRSGGTGPGGAHAAW